MLDWVKRIVTPVRRVQLVEKENQTHSTEDNVERLVTRNQANSKTSNEFAWGIAEPPVIVIASQKGGSGKTTIAAHLAVRAAMQGQGPAVLVDADPQGSLSEWWSARNEHTRERVKATGCAGNDDALALATVKLDDLTTHLMEVRSRGAAVVIIDTPPALTTSIEQVIAIADLVIVPARPSPHDLRAISATVHLARRAEKPFLFVINGAAPRANITAEAIAALSEHGQVAPVILFQRTDYAVSMIDGRTVIETASKGRSAREIAELWKYVYPRISRRLAA